MRNLKPLAPGQRLSASQYNKLIAELERQGHVSPSPLINGLDNAGGFHARLLQDWIWAKVTSGSGPYNWSQVMPNGTGGWTVATNGLSGTSTLNPAYEINGNTVTPFPQYVRLFPSKSGEWLFSWGAGCDDSGTTGLSTSLSVVTGVSCVNNVFTVTSKLMVFTDGLLTHIF